MLALLPAASAAQALSLNGTTEFGTRVELNAATRGVIRNVEVSPGQRVKQGAVLLKLDDTPHRATLSRTQAIARGLKPDVDIARLEMERAEELYALDSLSQVDLQNADNKLTRAEGALQAAEADRIAAEYELGRTVLTAPFDGRVLAVHVSSGQYVDPGVETTPLLTLVDSRNMIAVASIGGEQWRVSLLGQAARVRYRDKDYSGRISHLSLAPVQGTAGTGSASFLLHVAFTTDEPIPAGFPVSIDISN